MMPEEGQRVKAQGTTGDRKRFEGREGMVTELKHTLFGKPFPMIRVWFDGAKRPFFLLPKELTVIEPVAHQRDEEM